MPTLPLAAAIVFLALAALPFAAAADDPPPDAVIAIGGLDLRYDPHQWQVETSDAATVVSCIDDDCRDTSVAVTMDPDAGPESCSETAMLARFGLGFDDIGISTGDGLTASRIVNGLILHEARMDFGCRTLAGGPVVACTRLDGVTYRFDAPGNHCRTSWLHEEIVADLLSGLSPR